MSGKRCLQFGLRKVLLWTAVIALYLGVLTMSNLGLFLSAVLTSHVVYVGILRAIGWRAAAIGSLCIGTCIGVVVSSFAYYSSSCATVLDLGDNGLEFAITFGLLSDIT